MQLKNPDWMDDVVWPVPRQRPYVDDLHTSSLFVERERMTHGDVESFIERRRDMLERAASAAFEYGEYLALEMVGDQPTVHGWRERAQTVDLPPGMVFSITVRAGYAEDWNERYDGWATVDKEYDRRGAITVTLEITVDSTGTEVAMIDVLPTVKK